MMKEFLILKEPACYNIEDRKDLLCVQTVNLDIISWQQLITSQTLVLTCA